LLDDYLRIAQSLGLERLILVQPKAYGNDPACMLEIIAELGVARARGIIMPDEHLTSSDLKRLDHAGIRGVRYLFPDDAPIDTASIRAMANKIAPLQWSLIVQGGGVALADSFSALTGMPCPVVIDHLGRLPSHFATDSREFQALVNFVSTGGWIKLAAPYYSTPNGDADFHMVRSRVHALLDAGIERIIWGMNWPHPSFLPGCKPDDTHSLHSFLNVLRSPSEQYAIFVENPARLYGFTAA
jgi:predicted TIM-barrel fold metal-dependent hydrolase